MTHFQCKACGAYAPADRWLSLDSCPCCKAIGSIQQAPVSEIFTRKTKRADSGFKGEPTKPLAISDLPIQETPRLDMNAKGWRNPLPRGVTVLVSGDPGAGKSTFLLQSLSSVVGRVLYVVSEESVYRVAERARRIGANTSMRLLHCDSLYTAQRWIDAERPDIAVIDSVNMLRATEDAGENASLIERLEVLQRDALRMGVTVVCVSHVGKEGEIYGPRRLEHISDINIHIAVNLDETRTIHGVKNRFDSTGEYAHYTLEASGLVWCERNQEKEAS